MNIKWDKLINLIKLIRSIQVEPILLLYMFSSSLSNPTEEGLLYHKVCLTHFDKFFCTDYFSNILNNIQKYTIHKKNIVENETNLLLETKSKNFHKSFHKFRHLSFQTKEDQIQREASKWIMYTNIAMAIPSIITTLVFGAWSDSVNRKYPIMLSLIGLFISNLFHMLISFNVDKYPLEIFLVPNIIFGLFGASSTIFSSIFSYISHSTNKNSRILRLAFSESCIMIGGAIGFAASGIIIQKLGFYVFMLM